MRQFQQYLSNPRDLLLPPQWLSDVSRTCPFLLPLASRLAYFSLTSYGLGHCLRQLHEALRLEDEAARRGGRPGAGASALAAASGGEVDPRFSIQRRRVVVSRTRVLESAMKLLQESELIKGALVTVQFSHETGHGLGPTVEFYTLVCREAQRRSVRVWRDFGDLSAHKSDGTASAPDPALDFVHAPQVTVARNTMCVRVCGRERK